VRRQLRCLGCGRTFSTTPIIQAECTATPTISGRMASFNFLFLLHNFGTRLWRPALERRFWVMGTLERDM
jgi:predicted acyltransferase